jgi:hypothetical protein
MVPRPNDVKPPAISFSVVFWMGVGVIKKFSRYGVTKHDAPKSMMACVVSCVEPCVAIKIAIFKRVLFCNIDLYWIGAFCSSLSPIASGM